jgi:hypothetical protein
MLDEQHASVLCLAAISSIATSSARSTSTTTSRRAAGAVGAVQRALRIHAASAELVTVANSVLAAL